MIPKPKNELDKNVKMLSKTAFTLVEILVVISILMTLMIGLSKIDISKGQDVQRSLSFAQKIQLPIETAITNALIGKGVGTSLEVPKSWEISISKRHSGTIITNYNSGNIFVPYEKIEAEKHEEIREIKCFDLDGTSTENINGTGYIYITGSQIGTSCSHPGKIMKIFTKYKNGFDHIISINSVSGIIEKD